MSDTPPVKSPVQKLRAAAPAESKSLVPVEKRIVPASPRQVARAQVTKFKERMKSELALLSQGVESLVTMEDAEPTVIVPTLSPSFNRAIQIGGAPVRCVWAITGPFGSGKTAIAIEILTSFQAEGHLTWFVDAEHAGDTQGWFQALGVDPETVGYSRPNNYEDTVKDIARGIHNFKKAKAEKKIAESRCLAIVIDSINKLVPKSELEELMKTDLGRQYPLRAMLNSAWLDRMTPIIGQERIAFILLAQESAVVDAAPGGFGPKTKMKGGQRIGFDSSVIIRVNYAETVKEKVNAAVRDAVFSDAAAVPGDEVEEEVEVVEEKPASKGKGKGKKEEKEDVDADKTYVGKVHHYTIVKNKVGVCFEEGFLCTSTGKGEWPKGFDYPREVFLEALHRGVLKPKSDATYAHSLFGEDRPKGKSGLLRYLRTKKRPDGTPVWEALRVELDRQLRGEE